MTTCGKCGGKPTFKKAMTMPKPPSKPPRLFKRPSR